MRYSKHIRKRAQQRGIPENALALVFTMGNEIKAPGGATRYEMNSRICDERIRALRHEIELTERCRGISVLVRENTLLTTYRKGLP